MSVKELNDALIDVKENRNEIIEKLVDFANTDLLLFWGQNKDLMERQKQTWGPILSWASEAIKTKFSTTTSLNVPNQEDKTDEKLRLFLQSLSDKELVAFFKAA